MTMAAHFLDDLKRREHAVALATYAVNGTLGRNVGDPVHEEVTEGRRRQLEQALRAGQAWARNMPQGYHSCGDLAAWMLWRLGCRDESLVNRTNDGGTRAWVPGRNLAVIAGSRAFVNAAPGREPRPGDILFLNQNGGHVGVLLEWDEAAGRCASADYGQPYGRRRSRRITRRSGALLLDGVTLRGWLDLDRVTFDGPVNLDGLP
jgi:hypothetical protein